MYYINVKNSAKINPITLITIPFRKILDLGLNIQKEEITKNNKEIPKIVFKIDSLCLESDLCKSVIFFKK